MLVLASFVLLLAAAAITARDDSVPPVASRGAAPAVSSVQEAADEPLWHDETLRLYDRVAARVATGENYYAAAVEEQRARDFAVRPGVAVRLPTLAFVSGHVGQWGMLALALVLGAAIFVAWWDRLESEPGGRDYRTYVLVLLGLGVLAGFRPHYLALHELWAGLFVALSLGLHRPGKWIWAVLAAAAALALRELALPFVLLMGAMALLRGDRAEAVAWGLLLVAFAVAMAIHVNQVAANTGPADPVLPSWFALRGLGGWTGNIVASSPLQLLPAWLAAPLALVPLIGWAGWRSDLGLAGLLLCAGYGAAFMVAGHDTNSAWAMVLMPVWFAGLAFVPRALASLWASAGGR